MSDYNEMKVQYNGRVVTIGADYFVGDIEVSDPKYGKGTVGIEELLEAAFDSDE